MAYADPARGAVKRRAGDLNEAPSAKKRKLDASLVVPYAPAFDGTDWFKLDFYKAVEHFGMYAIINWEDTASVEPCASMLHAAIMASDYENLWAVHQLIDMGADVESRGRVWFLGFDLSPLELCAFFLGFSLRDYLGADLVVHARLCKDVDVMIFEYCRVIEHLTRPLVSNVLAVNWVLEGLWHPIDRTGEPARPGQAHPDESAWAVRDRDPMEGSLEALLVKHIFENTSFRRAFELRPLGQGGPSGLDYPSYQAGARAAARHKREVESEVAAAMKKREKETQYPSEEELFG
jgi:hypothetical protein